ncbi:YkgJ family cysteine cluster protein [Nitratifractor sp.]
MGNEPDPHAPRLTPEGFLELDGYPYRFDPSVCAACEGACCRGESGYVWVRYGEIEAIARHLEMGVEDFATIYLRKVGHRYSLIEKKLGEGDYACVFFDVAQRRCSIYPVRPRQCRTFPFWESFQHDEDEVRKECPGIV